MTLFHPVLRNLRTLCIDWSLVRRQVNRRLTRLQTVWNFLKYCKIFQNGSVRLRCGCGYFFKILKTSTVGCVYSVAPFITVNAFNPDCSFTLMLHFLLQGDHFIRIYLTRKLRLIRYPRYAKYGKHILIVHISRSTFPDNIFPELCFIK